MIGVDDLLGLPIGVAGRLGGSGLLELAVETPEHDPRIADRLQRMPGHHDLGRGIRAELEMQPGDRRRRHRIGGSGGVGPGRAGRGLGPAGSGEGRGQRGASGDAGGGEQLATTEREIEPGVLCHDGEVPRLWRGDPIAIR
jgi:hypothetical protein